MNIIAEAGLAYAASEVGGYLLRTFHSKTLDRAFPPSELAKKTPYFISTNIWPVWEFLEAAHQEGLNGFDNSQEDSRGLGNSLLSYVGNFLKGAALNTVKSVFQQASREVTILTLPSEQVNLPERFFYIGADLVLNNTTPILLAAAGIHLLASK